MTCHGLSRIRKLGDDLLNETMRLGDMQTIIQNSGVILISSTTRLPQNRNSEISKYNSYSLIFHPGHHPPHGRHIQTDVVRT